MNDDDPDPRVRCDECRHYRKIARRCDNHRAAGLAMPSVGSDLASLPQWCPGFNNRPQTQATNRRTER